MSRYYSAVRCKKDVCPLFEKMDILHLSRSKFSVESDGVVENSVCPSCAEMWGVLRCKKSVCPTAKTARFVIRCKKSVCPVSTDIHLFRSQDLRCKKDVCPKFYGHTSFLHLIWCCIKLEKRCMSSDFWFLVNFSRSLTDLTFFWFIWQKNSLTYNILNSPRSIEWAVFQGWRSYIYSENNLTGTWDVKFYFIHTQSSICLEGSVMPLLIINPRCRIGITWTYILNELPM